ncbi:hypothetical protein J6590_038712 [Homalodisca vitripennis]|nr:hypothetical protein J6590_038712 [Homalodisca vitripennis]
MAQRFSKLQVWAAAIKPGATGHAGELRLNGNNLLGVASMTLDFGIAPALSIGFGYDPLVLEFKCSSPLGPDLNAGCAPGFYKLNNPGTSLKATRVNDNALQLVSWSDEVSEATQCDGLAPIWTRGRALGDCPYQVFYKVDYKDDINTRGKISGRVSVPPIVNRYVTVYIT